MRVSDSYSEEFGVGVGVHQGSILSPLLFIIVLEALPVTSVLACLGSCSLLMFWSLLPDLSLLRVYTEKSVFYKIVRLFSVVVYSTYFVSVISCRNGTIDIC